MSEKFGNSPNIVNNEQNKKDFRESIINILNRMGQYQTVLIIALCFFNTISSVNHVVTSFHTYVPNFQCADYDSVDACGLENQSCTNGYIFDETDDFTLVSEWSLVCLQNYLAPIINMTYFIGTAIGSPLFGLIADRWGRKFAIILSLFVQGVIGVVLYFVNSYELFVILRTMQGVFVQGLQVCAYTLMLEYSPSRLRVINGCGFQVNWAIGMMIVGIESYFIRNWRYLQLALGIPTIFCLLYVWCLPESIFWLYAKRRYSEALKLACKIARLNDDHEKLDDLKKFTAQNLKNEQIDEEPKASFINIVKDLGKTACLRKHLLIMMSAWFIITLSYFMTLYIQPAISVSRHKNFFIGIAIELVFYVVPMPFFMKFGCRKILMIMQVCAGITMLFYVAVVLLLAGGLAKDWILSISVLIAKGCSNGSFLGLFLYTCELFPTSVRVAALGITGITSRIGSATAPFVIASEHLIIIAVVIGAMLIVNGLVTLLLPDTNKAPILNSVSEAKEKWEK